MHKDGGFTLIELLVVVAILGIIAAIAIPGLLRARQAGNESSAIGAVRTVNSGQTAYASTCGGGGYAQSNADLTKAPPGGTPFVSPDLQEADQPGHEKSGYRIAVSDGADALNQDVMLAAATCNASAGNTRLMYFVSADPARRGQDGERSFASDRRGVIFYDYAAAIPNPVPAALDTFIQ